MIQKQKNVFSARRWLHLTTKLPIELTVQRLHELLSKEMYSVPHNPRQHYIVRTEKVLDFYAFEVQVLSNTQGKEVIKKIRGEIREHDNETIIEIENIQLTRSQILIIIVRAFVLFSIFLFNWFQPNYGSVIKAWSVLFAVIATLIFVFSTFGKFFSSQVTHKDQEIMDTDIKMINLVIQPRNEDRNLVARLQLQELSANIELETDDPKTQTQFQ